MPTITILGIIKFKLERETIFLQSPISKVSLSKLTSLILLMVCASLCKVIVEIQGLSAAKIFRGTEWNAMEIVKRRSSHTGNTD